MRRSPFYSFPHFAPSFYAPPAEAAYLCPRRPFRPSPPTPTRGSLINIPVFDSSPSCPPSSPPQPPSPPTSNFSSLPLIDPSSAATIIQSHFRGFYVRRHHPLLHLRSIAHARKQLEELQSDLESPGFLLKIRASEKERLRFSESVMAIVLRLDAIEGAMAEVRSQRKEVTKMAVKLQDAIDAIIVEKDEVADVKYPVSDGGMLPNDDDVLCEQSVLCPGMKIVQGRVDAISEEGAMHINAMQEDCTSPEDDAVEKCMPNLHKDDGMAMVDENVSTLLALKVDDAGQQREAGEGLMNKLGCFESVPQRTVAKAMYEAEQAQQEINNGIDALQLEAHERCIKNNDMIIASQGSHVVESADGSFTCMEVVEEVKEGPCEDVELCPGTPTAEEKCEYSEFSNAAYHNQLQGPSAARDGLEQSNCRAEGLTQSSCSLDSKGYPISDRHGYERCSNAAHENHSDEGIRCDNGKAQSSSLSMVGTSSLHDCVLLHQLSEDCRQLKSLVGKLLVQNKAQSKVLCALGERLDLLENQNQFDCQRNQRNVCAKRKLKKGSKRSVKCRNSE